MLTGGGSLLTGVREHAARVLDKQVRVGRPLGLHGLAEATEGPAFAAAAGLLVYADRVPGEEHLAAMADGGLGNMGDGRFQRLGRWFKENF